MTTSRVPHGFSTLVKSLRDVIASLGAIAIPHRLTPIPVSAGRRDASGATRRVPSPRRVSWLPVLVGILLLAAVPARAGQATLPAGVPNIFDEEVQAQFQPVGVTNLGGSSDFPAVLLADSTEDQSQAILFGLDARNEKDTWSLTEDPIILIVVFSNTATIKALYVDAGFVDTGKPSGNYTEVYGVDSAHLPDLLKTVFAATMQTLI